MEERNSRGKAKAKFIPAFGLSYFSSQYVFLNITTNFSTAPSISPFALTIGISCGKEEEVDSRTRSREQLRIADPWEPRQGLRAEL